MVIRSAAHQALVSLLRRIRVEADLRQEDLADALDRPQSFVSKYESGERRLDLLEVRAICEACGTSLPAFSQRFEEELE